MIVAGGAIRNLARNLLLYPGKEVSTMMRSTHLILGSLGLTLLLLAAGCPPQYLGAQRSDDDDDDDASDDDSEDDGWCECSAGEFDCQGQETIRVCEDGCNWTPLSCDTLCQDHGWDLSDSCSYDADSGHDTCWCSDEEIVDLTVESWGCTNCAGSGFEGGESSDWEITLGNKGTVPVNYFAFQIRLIAEEYVADACGSTGYYEYYDAGSYYLTGNCQPLGAGDTCTTTVDNVSLPNAYAGSYKWMVKADWENEIDEVDEFNNIACSNDWIQLN